MKAYLFIFLRAFLALLKLLMALNLMKLLVFRLYGLRDKVFCIYLKEKIQKLFEWFYGCLKNITHYVMCNIIGMVDCGR